MKCKTCGYEPSHHPQNKRMTRKEIINTLTDPKLLDDYEGFYQFYKLNKHTLIAMDMGPSHDGSSVLVRIDLRLIEDKKPTMPEEVINLFLTLVSDPKYQIPEVNHITHNLYEEDNLYKEVDDTEVDDETNN